MTDRILDKAKITADSIFITKDGLLLSGARVRVELPTKPLCYLYSGWQSWSLTAWMEADRPIHPMRPSSLHPLQTDPVYAHETRPHGAWYGAVELPDGRVLFLGALGLESHVLLVGQTLSGWYEKGQGEWFMAQGEEDEIFDLYAHLLKERFTERHIQKPLRIWCSWYSLYSEIHADKLIKILNDLGDLPFDVFQVDDGWQKTVGDWEPNDKFLTGMDNLATRIQKTGRKAGLWLAPFIVVRSSNIYRDHRNWLLQDEQGKLVSAGFNWGEQLYALDTTHPEVLDWLAALMKKVRLWGYEYIKLDFLCAGALPGTRHVDIPRETAYRNGLKVIRAALDDAYILAVGAPILPSLGLCDALRVGPDVASYWTSHRDDYLLMNYSTPGTRNAIRTTLNRLWLDPLVHTDPDITYFRSRQDNLSSEQKTLLQDLALITGIKATSDVPAWMAESELNALRKFLESKPLIQKKSRTCYEIDGDLVDFSPHISMPSLPGPFTNFLGSVVGALANIPSVMRIFEAINRLIIKNSLQKNPL